MQHRIRSYFSIIHQILITSTNVSRTTVNGNERVLCYACFLFTQGISEELTDVSFM